jgi:hypothetical protein
MDLTVARARYAATSTSGYALGGWNTLPLKQAEFITLSAVIALRASQQAHSHCKAVLQLDNSPQLLRTLDSVARDLAERSQTPLPEKPVVTNLEKEL